MFANAFNYAELHVEGHCVHTAVFTLHVSCVFRMVHLKLFQFPFSALQTISRRPWEVPEEFGVCLTRFCPSAGFCPSDHAGRISHALGHGAPRGLSGALGGGI